MSKIARSYRIVSDVGSNVNLDRIGRTNGLDALINMSVGTVRNGLGPGTVASTVEAIVGAVYLDSNMSSVTQVMQNLGLIPKLVRKISNKLESSTSKFEGQDGPDVDSVDMEEKLATVMRTSHEIEKSVQQYSTLVQRKQLGVSLDQQQEI